MTSVFVAHSPFQRFIAEHMVAAMPEFAGHRTMLVLDMPASDPGGHTTARWASVMVVEPPLGGSILGAGRRMRSVISQITSHLSSDERAALFLSNVQWPLNNWLAREISRPPMARRVTWCNFPEGIGSLRIVHPDLRQRARDPLKSLVAAVGGSRYYPVRGDLMGLERCTRIYSLLPDLLPAHLAGKVVAIPGFPIDSRATAFDTCIFLGQHDRFVPDRQRRLLADRAAQHCAGLGYTRRLFKSHHYGESAVQREAFAARGFEMMADARPIEQVMLERAVACVVSFNSSALVHLKMMFGPAIRCMSLFADEIGRYGRTRRADSESVLAILEQSGVEMHKWNPSLSPSTHG